MSNFDQWATLDQVHDLVARMAARIEHLETEVDRLHKGRQKDCVRYITRDDEARRLYAENVLLKEQIASNLEEE